MSDRIVNLKDEAGNICYPVGLAPANTVTTSMINDSSVTSAKLASNAVVTSKIADNAVTAAKLSSNTVATANIQDSAVTSAKLASSSVTGSKVDFSTIPQVNYTTGEVAVGTWIDGKTLYRTTTTIGTLPGNSSISVQTAATNVDVVTNIEGSAWNNNNTWVTIPRATGFYVNIWFDPSTNMINVSTNDAAGANLSKATITMYYTKTV